MRIVLAVVLAVSTLAPACAADSTPSGLAAGKPSGVRPAQNFALNYPVIFAGAAGAILLGGYLLAKHNITNTAATTGTSP